MRFFLWLFVVACLALLVPRTAAAESTRTIELHARRVDFYSERFVLTADGDVRAQLSDGTVVRGDTFSMDLKLNRFLIAGNVRVDGPHVHAVGAAFAGFPDLDRDYFLTTGPVPDRWTWFGLDFSDPHKGRQQPGDAFFFSDVSGRPYIVADAATIFLKNNVEFPVGSRILVEGVYTPTPGYVVNYSSNPNFYQNAFQGAVFDIAEPFHGAADAISALHLRYDQQRGFYTAFDQHFVHNLDYAVLSVDPLTQNQRQYNAILYKRLSPALEVHVFFQLSDLSRGLSLPDADSAFTNFTLNTKVGRYAVGLNADQYNDSLLNVASNPDFVPEHPFNMTLNVQSYEDEFRLFRYIGVPVKFQYRGGYGYNNDSYGLPTVQGYSFQGALYPSIWEKYLGLTVYSAPVHIAKLTTISAKADRLEQWYSLPHHVVTTDVSETIARTPLKTKLPAFLLTYDVLNIGDFYGAQQSVAYPAEPDVIVNQYGTFTGLAAFDGFATSRSLSGSMVYTPTPYFALNLTLQHFDVTPAPIPGYGGQPPLQLGIDMRVRVDPHLLVDLSRSYYFNFGSDLWSPEFGIQFSP
jgi:hypothetical protein